MPAPILAAWLAPLITSILTWIFRKVVIGFVLGASIFFVIQFLTPVLIRIAGDWFNVSVPNFINSIPAGVWYFCSIFKLEYGIKVTISALATRFLIRRIPFIG